MITLSFFIFQCVLQVFSFLFLNFFIPSDKGQEKLSLFQNAQAYCCSQLPFIQFTYPGIKFCLPTACTALLVSEPQRCQICVFLPIVWNIRCVVPGRDCCKHVCLSVFIEGPQSVYHKTEYSLSLYNLDSTMFPWLFIFVFNKFHSPNI